MAPSSLNHSAHVYTPGDTLPTAQKKTKTISLGQNYISIKLLLKKNGIRNQELLKNGNHRERNHNVVGKDGLYD